MAFRSCAGAAQSKRFRGALLAVRLRVESLRLLRQSKGRTSWPNFSLSVPFLRG